MKRPRFYTSYAGHEHYAPIVSPTATKLKSWWYEFSTIVEHYDVYLVGSLAEKMFGEYNGRVGDMDIVLSGEVKNFDTLKHILREGIRLGFKQNIFCDIKHQTPVVTPWEPFEPFAVIKPATTWVTMYDNKLSQRNSNHYDQVTLHNGLVQQIYTKPPKYYYKFNAKRKKGYQGIIKQFNKDFQL